MRREEEMRGRRAKGAFGPVVWIALAALALLQGCAPRSGIVPLRQPQLQARPLRDDMQFRGLPEALRQSLRYYGSLPASATFEYGDQVYSAREMEASTRLFLGIVENLTGEERLEAIRRKFRFFESRNSDGKAFFTGYYEPVLTGSLEPSGSFSQPLYAVPADLVRVDLLPYVALGLLPGGLRNTDLRGKLDAGVIVPFDDRERIVYGNSLQGRAKPLAYVSSHIELAFLQIQGSGMIRLEDGSLLRLNYADQNGHPYRAIGRLLLDKIPREEMSLQRIRDYLLGHPDEVKEILNYNPSYTFFRITEEGPLGSIGVPLTPGRSVAMDHRLLPRGGIVYLETTYPVLNGEQAGEPSRLRRFGVVQDTGGAIRGHGRVDLFWGSGVEAERLAGPMKQAGRVFLLVARREFLQDAGAEP